MTKSQIERFQERFYSESDRIKALQYSIDGTEIKGLDAIELELDQMCCRLASIGDEFAQKTKEGSK